MTTKYSELLLAHNEELEAKQEKFSALLVQHDEELNRLVDALPEMRAELLGAVLPDLTQKLDAAIPAMVLERVGAEAASLAAVQTKRLGEIRDEIVALARAGLESVTAEKQRIISLDEIREALAEMAKTAADDTALRLLVGRERQIEAQIAAALAAHPVQQVQLAATAGLADAFRGAFAVGLRAERGEIWTWLGSAYICLETTGEPPNRRSARVGRGAWGLLASSGSGGGGGGTGGDSLPSQTAHAGEYLTTDGTTASWAVVTALPDQTGANGKFLTTDGTDASWATLAGGGDMVAANNLSDVVTASVAFDNIKQAASTLVSGVVFLAPAASVTAGHGRQGRRFL